MIELTDILVRLSLAAFFGGIIGLERERKEWAAGLRTHMMVCVGSALIMLVSTYGFMDVLDNESIILDPSRIASQVVSGIGFIGAGTILFLRRGIIRGLTTASGLWTVAAIGLATGAGMYFAAAAATVIALIILWLLQYVERVFISRFTNKTIDVNIRTTENSSDIVSILFSKKDLSVVSCHIEKENTLYLISIRVNSPKKENIALLIDALKALPGVAEITWRT